MKKQLTKNKTLPKFTSIAFTFLHMVAMFRPAEPVLEYIINYDYIANVLCINKNKPCLKCNGKCYLMQQLKKQQDSETPSSRIQLENYPIGFIEVLELSHPSKPIIIKKSKNNQYKNLYDYLADLSFFHPPSV
ncbi:hypothetical protein [Mesonia aquimarina]|uniref:hypothetical protein n=1 Tax=Mesonia aquimarina TaxID=1504967 RepID=UPI0019693D8E|nr:hypothetical protein [Mesonia aquimarina]